MAKATGRKPRLRRFDVDLSPSTASDILGPPPLIPGEDEKAYDALYARVAAAVKPADFLEEIWVRDVADLVWEAFRLRRLKTAFLIACTHKGVEKTVNGLEADGWMRADRLAKAWARREKDALEEVDELLAKAGLDLDSVMAQTLAAEINDIERIDRLVAAAETRRNAILREVDRHRASLAEALRRAAQVEEAEFETLPPEAAAGQAAE